MKKTKLLTIFFCIAAAVLLIGALHVFRLNHNDSQGWQLLKTQDSYTPDSLQMNGADSHTLNLTAGDVLQITFETEKGSLHMEITAPDGTILYAGNGEDATAFEINIQETGAYTITVEARHAEGKINIHLVEKNEMRHTTPTIITYGSCYGSTEHYAKKFAEYTDSPVLPYREVKNLSGYARIIHFGALYAGGVLGLRQIVEQLPSKAELVIVTVGLADVQDAENIQHIRSAIRRQIPEDVIQSAQIFHLRGAIDYGKLNLKHRTMMAMLFTKAKGLPEEKKNAETRAMIETYGKQVSFVDDTAVMELVNSIE